MCFQKVNVDDVVHTGHSRSRHASRHAVMLRHQHQAVPRLSWLADLLPSLPLSRSVDLHLPGTDNSTPVRCHMTRQAHSC